MAKAKTARVADVVGLLNKLCSPLLAEDWDNVGLQVGDHTAPVTKVLICLDAEEPALREAEKIGAQLIISHHPVIFRPLKRVSPSDATGRILFSAIKNNIAIASAHTNLDRAADGLNDWLADALQLTAVTPLEAPATDGFVKLVVYVPLGYEQAVMEELFAAGAGQIGAYDRCSFRVLGTGTFRGNDSSHPVIGQPGRQEAVEELRLETLVAKPLLAKVLQGMRKAHPYEEVAYDVIPLANPDQQVGLGRIGRLPMPLSLGAFAAQVKEALQADALRLVGDPEAQLEKIAVCGGSGMAVFADAQRQGADCLVTGDVKFHDAQRARAEGVALIDAGHFATERLMIGGLSRRLRRLCEESQFDIEIIEMTAEQDPFVAVF
ncbi:Nif3-like dinuclear metal center hexameric protein [Pelobacter seleniigenes]|uniref:Nif3-like dinuclear metal center hexameric protein n=1 Tax=Pelobacter seleniigenes TaxID=407188 RepID=UPI0004A6B0EF|nr:Nif3-like dinuclear metal center hexameric protein [Pelobacter seleniigenes]